MPPEKTVVDANMRRTLMGLADVLLPSDGCMPAASSAGVHASGIDRVLASRPDIAPALLRVLRTAAGRDPLEEIRRLKAADNEGFLALASACAGAYYQDAEVRRLIGYPGQEPSLPEPGEAEHELTESILEPVVARGSIYRTTP